MNASMQAVEITNESIYKLNQELTTFGVGKLMVSVTLLRNTKKGEKKPAQHTIGYTLRGQKYYNITISPDSTFVFSQSEAVNNMKETIVLEAGNVFDVLDSLKKSLELIKVCNPKKLTDIYYIKNDTLYLTGYNNKIRTVKAKYGKELHFIYSVSYATNPHGEACIGIKLHNSTVLNLTELKLKDIIYHFSTINLSLHAVALMNYGAKPLFKFTTNLYEVKNETEGIEVKKTRKIPSKTGRKGSFF